MENYTTIQFVQKLVPIKNWGNIAPIQNMIHKYAPIRIFQSHVLIPNVWKIVPIQLDFWEMHKHQIYFWKKLHIFKKIYIKNCIELLIGVIFPEFDVGVFWPKNAPIHEGNTSGAQRPRARTLRAQGCLESSEVGDTKFFRNLRHRQVHLVLYHFWSDSHGRGGTRELCLSFGTPGSDYAKTEEHSPS